MKVYLIGILIVGCSAPPSDMLFTTGGTANDASRDVGTRDIDAPLVDAGTTPVDGGIGLSSTDAGSEASSNVNSSAGGVPSTGGVSTGGQTHSSGGFQSNGGQGGLPSNGGAPPAFCLNPSPNANGCGVLYYPCNYIPPGCSKYGQTVNGVFGVCCGHSS